jgi:REP element-mobilizing transposase RayT
MMSTGSRRRVATVGQLDLAIELTPRRWGGARRGAGRKAVGRRSDSPHRPRPVHRKWQPVHVVLRTRPDVPRLRRRKVFEAVRRALRAIASKHAFRVVHMSIQRNHLHLHLLVEADSGRALSRGMQALDISLARRINRACGRRGKVFAHRFHATPITSPRQARNALAYVLNNWRRHREDVAAHGGHAPALDRFSSAISFDGWVDATRFAIPTDYTPLPVACAQTWLLRVGWRRHPAIDWREVPADR